jgi:hypothetical protein
MNGEFALDSDNDPEAARESLERIATSDLPYAEYARRALAQLADENINGTEDTENENKATEDGDE